MSNRALNRLQVVPVTSKTGRLYPSEAYVTVAGELLALAETDQGQIVPKRVFNLAGLTGSAGKEKGN